MPSRIHRLLKKKPSRRLEKARVWLSIEAASHTKMTASSEFLSFVFLLTYIWRFKIFRASQRISLSQLTLILRRSRTGTVWFYTYTSNKRAARPKLYTKSLTRDLKHMYICM